MVIYTKRGDKGKTGLISSNEQVSKSSAQIKTIGAIDELNSFLGVVVADSQDLNTSKMLINIQKDLLTIGSILAGSKLRFYKTRARRLETAIDKMEGELPVLKNFIVPGGSKLASNLHYARTLVRRAERKVVELSKTEPVNPQILIYINRLSDFLFMLARKVNYNLGETEVVWSEKEK